MTKSLGELQTHYESGSTSIADCWLVVRKDGTQLGFTDSPEDLTIGGVLYEGNAGFDRTATEASSGLGADNHMLIGIIDSDRVTVEDIQGRKYQGATVYHFSVNRNNPTGTQDKHGYGFIGQIRLRGKVWEAEYTSLATLLEREVGEVTSPYCRVRLGSTRCGVTLNPDVWTSAATVAVGDVVRNPTYDGRRHVAVSAGVTSTGVPAFASTVGSTTSDGTVTWQTAEGYFKHFSVTSVISERNSFVASVLGGMTDNYYQFGEVVFSTGANATLEMDVKTNNSVGNLEVLFDFPFAIAVGDEGYLTVGCNHKLKDAGDTPGTAYTGHCRAKFSNAANFQGDPETPGLDVIVAGDVQ